MCRVHTHVNNRRPRALSVLLGIGGECSDDYSCLGICDSGYLNVAAANRNWLGESVTNFMRLCEVARPRECCIASLGCHSSFQ